MPITARIALMLPRYSRYGGVEQFGYRLSAWLAERGAAVDFLCARQEVEAPSGVRVLSVGRPRLSKRAKMDFFARKVEEMRLAGDYDCAISLGKTLNQDILRVGGAPLREFWRYSETALPAGPLRWLKSLRRKLSPAGRLSQEIEDQQYHSGCKIVANSHFVRDRILNAYPQLKAEEIEIIYNRPDLTRYHPPKREESLAARADLGIAPGQLAVGLATSNYLLKGTGPLIQALAQLPENYHLFIAGGRGHSQYDSLAKRLRVAGRVHFLGKVDDMPRFYRALDIFTLPSFYDACSNAVLEALASGLPTLSSASNGSSFFLPPENVVSNPGDSAALAETLLRLTPQALENRERDERPGFNWPTDIKAGMEGFTAVVEEFLAR
ncbi:MAG: glycosyltransferase family 4 protein [Deltaproteobacteria bacterium]|nr:glycosyltransferase family 4 protein [Deltaproteobacteria bacterium]